MSDWKHRFTDSFHWKKLLQYFFQGLVILAPLGITIYAVYVLFNAVDNFLPDIIHTLYRSTIDYLFLDQDPIYRH